MEGGTPTPSLSTTYKADIVPDKVGEYKEEKRRADSLEDELVNSIASYYGGNSKR